MTDMQAFCFDLPVTNFPTSAMLQLHSHNKNDAVLSRIVMIFSTINKSFLFSFNVIKEK